MSEDEPKFEEVDQYHMALDEIERLRAERDGFYMDYRMKCDEETKRLAAELAEAETLLRRARDCIDGMDADNWKALPEEHYSRGTPAAVTEIDAWLARRSENGQ